MSPGLDYELWCLGRRSEFPRNGLAGKWKDVFTSADRETSKRAAGDLMIELGYEAEAAW